MDEKIAKEVALEVISQTNYALIGTVNQKKNPNIKALFKVKHEDLNKFYFNTQIDSVKVRQMRLHEEGCVYFFDPMRHIGILLEGKFSIINNVDAGISEIYQAMNMREFNLCTIEFTTKTVNVYKDHETKIFDI